MLINVLINLSIYADIYSYTPQKKTFKYIYIKNILHIFCEQSIYTSNLADVCNYVCMHVCMHACMYVCMYMTMSKFM